MTLEEHALIAAARFSLLRMYATRWDTGTWLRYSGKASMRIRHAIGATLAALLLFTGCASSVELPTEREDGLTAHDVALLSVVHAAPEDCTLGEAPRHLECDMGGWHALINTATGEAYLCDEETECPNTLTPWLKIVCNQADFCTDTEF